MEARPAMTPATIEAALSDLRLRELHVDVSGDAITVQGIAPCYRTKHDAIKRIHAVLPDACISNELRVAQADTDERTLAADVTAALRTVDDTADARVAVRDGVVLIHAAARDDETRRAMIAAAWEAAAGHHVRAEIAVSLAEDAAVEAALNAYIQRSMGRNDRNVRITYAAGVATLTGRVSSMARACALEDLLRWHDGVADVVNRLSVAPSFEARSPAGKAS
jgi:osmotically-inducible protein OsmY